MFTTRASRLPAAGLLGLLISGCSGAPVVQAPATASVAVSDDVPLGYYLIRTIPPDPTVSLAKANAAIQRKDWNTAIAALWDAHRVSPRDPEILYNLGLAHDRAGHDMLALAWLRAALATQADGPNGTALRKEVADLEKRARDDVTIALRRSEQAARLLGDAGKRTTALANLAQYVARSGDIALAKELSPDMTDAKAFGFYGEQLAEHGACAELVDLVQAMPSLNSKELLQKLAQTLKPHYPAQASRIDSASYSTPIRGEPVRAACADVVRHPPDYIEFSDTPHWDGEVAAARERLRKPTPVPKPRYRDNVLEYDWDDAKQYMTDQLTVGSVESARQMARAVIRTSCKSAGQNGDCTAMAYAVLGERKQALARQKARYKSNEDTPNNVLFNAPDYFDRGYTDIAFALVMIGDEAGARAVASAAEHESTRITLADGERWTDEHRGNAEAGMARAFCLQGKPDKALEALSHTRAFTRTDAERDVYACLMQAKDLPHAEAAASMLWPLPVPYRPNEVTQSAIDRIGQLVTLAAAYLGRGDKTHALALAHAAREAMATASAETEIPATNTRLCQILDDAGDAAGASSCRQGAQVDALARYISIARDLTVTPPLYKTPQQWVAEEAAGDIAAQFPDQFVTNLASWSLGLYVTPLMQMREIEAEFARH